MTHLFIIVEAEIDLYVCVRKKVGLKHNFLASLNHSLFLIFSYLSFSLANSTVVDV